METLVLIAHAVLVVAIVALVLLQQGKGSDVGAAFGSGASSTFFGGAGSANILSRTTAVLAALFFSTSFALALFASQETERALQVDLPAGFSQPAAEEILEEDEPYDLLPGNDFPEPPAGDDFPEPPE